MEEDDLSVDVNTSSFPLHVTASSTVKFDGVWNLSTGYLRPQLFCLEHAIETVELLRPKGGANVLGICHSGNDRLLNFSSLLDKNA